MNIRMTYAIQMACALGNVGRHQEAHFFATEAVELATACHGPESEPALIYMHTHAGLLISAGQVHEGIAMLTHVLATQRRVLGADHVSTRDTKRFLDAMSAAVGA